MAMLAVLPTACAPRPEKPRLPGRDAASRTDEKVLRSRAAWFDALLQDPEAEIDLVEAATIIAAHRSDVTRPYSEIPRFLEPALRRVRQKVGAEAAAEEKIRALNEELLPVLRSAPVGHMKWLYTAVASMDGPCFFNTLMYLIAGDALGLRLEAVFIPGHAFVACEIGGRRRNIETTAHGHHRSAEEYRKHLLKDPASPDALPELPDALERALRPVSRRQVVAAMLLQRADDFGSEDAELAARLAPEFDEPWIRLAELFERKGDFDQAERCLAEALLRAPHLPSLHCTRAALRMRRKKLKEALDDIDAALRLAPGAAYYHHVRGFTLYVAGRTEEAWVSLTRAVEMAPRSPVVRLARALVLEKLDRVPEAIGECSAAIAADPKCAQAYTLRAELWSRMGDDRNAEADARKAEELGAEP
jgi:Tfp pilus assembly protein PilF